MLILPIENWAREAFVRTDLMKIYICNGGGQVLIAPKNSINKFIHRVKGNYLHKSLQPGFNESIKKLKENGGSYFYLDEESIVRDTPLERRYGLKPELVDFVISCSEEETISFKKNGFLNILESGNPRFNLKKGLKKISNRNSILFSSTFSLIRPGGRHNLESVLSEWKFSENEKNDLIDFINRHKKREPKVINVLKKLSKFYKVTYRVHPLENFKEAKKVFEDFPIEIEKGGDIRESIQKHDYILHSGCSVGFEAALMGKPSFFVGANSDDKKSIVGRASLHIGLNDEITKIVEFLKNHTEINNDILSESTFGKKISKIIDSNKIIANKLLEFKYESSSSEKIKNRYRVLISGLVFNLISNFDGKEKERFDQSSESYLRQVANANNIKILEFPRRHFWCG